MTLKAAKTWFLRLLPVVLFFICYYCSQFYFESYGGSGKSPQPTVSLCHNYRLQWKWESLKLNMSRKTELFLKLEDFFWREHLSAEALPYGIKGSELLLLKVLAMTSSYTMPANIESSLDCRTCAVIGNGFSIKNSSLGEIINKYDVVIRLNDAPVRGYEEDVGNKTTLRLFYPESASYNPGIHNDPDTLLALVPFKQQDLRWLKEILYDEKRVRKGFWKPPPQIWLGGASQIRVLDPYFLRLTASKLLQIPLQPHRQQKLVHPTSGILAVFVALNYCDVVHVAGFGYPESRNQKQPIHYYGKETMKSMKNSYHDLNQEALMLKRLEDQGAVLYLHPHS
ncbi:CMP-N-acetylneuraminate-beta-galactosamide-alpha-2,3-sialyltransferase 4-like isoform X1 [Sinocyclocheilus rhinocerous]|uniref:CMP-N-acetylneuraminate-beta-galactosamide- alpha-2,3-sialyltransferase 4-like isoform X1 n=1 Tax=Sinocyclocheilus rhinocerous TaxID=307959 RepID=UPI0007B92D07|nr:PREDICTED: CMP-N-acetylneuraminate-beta-galactosamide-alpha-2,3-sialyltransferase 4-like isoform X1 [Sinocyclocheilus rhinocerous]XP_016369550.1 PREDICTED: CMP-N-acetylneuraminate-beta-galactosamide-alpha-2,3-sialyltransferase 4-like isoform X1 [Sinocyclocheilus rhinocerous]XP_016369551.1 PREDICTED: CMP-N-acetylneuraminate-beta-galactosamide-alpha-2,3-sialyltransferase 4-like isoform X1 [Sinocyclocheilus rhinocerous]XP_016369552.1 PREDICTED: CMP-N-acetylneuraminate-beta-galactosamide-alpha-2,